jgi:hypothetical protein
VLYPNYVGILNYNIDSLTFNISDTSVIRYDSANYQFVTKDTGTAHIVFSYKGFVDTAFIYVSVPKSINNIINGCSQGNILFYAGIDDNTYTYQWQVDSSGSFLPVTSSTIYTGADSSTLVLINPPTNWYNYKYRCVISDPIGSSYSESFILKFSSTWIGDTDNTWENPANWSCGVLPDRNTDVIVNSSAPYFPQVNSNVECRSLTLRQGSSAIIKTGFRIDIFGIQ